MASAHPLHIPMAALAAPALGDVPSDDDAGLSGEALDSLRAAVVQSIADGESCTSLQARLRDSIAARAGGDHG